MANAKPNVPISNAQFPKKIYIITTYVCCVIKFNQAITNILKILRKRMQKLYINFENFI